MWVVSVFVSATLALISLPAFAAPLNESIESGELGGVVAVVVEQHGEVLYARQFEPGHKRRGSQSAPELHDIRSAGKSLTALAVGAAIADGHLASVDVPVWALLGQQARGAKAEITVRDLLTMSSALDCNDWQGRSSPGFEERMYRHKHWRAFVLGLPEAEGYERDATGLGRFSYCTAGVFLLGQVVQQATGVPFDDYLQRRILTPIGVNDVVWRYSRSGEVQSGGQLEISAASLVKLGRLVLDGGVWHGKPLVPEAWVDQMFTPQRQVHPYVHYGYLWWGTSVGTPAGPRWVWSMMGNGGNVVAVVPDYDAVVVVQAANYKADRAGEQSFGLVIRALAALER